MKDSILKILLGIIAINLTIQTVTGGGFFPKSEAQSQSEMQAALVIVGIMPNLRRTAKAIRSEHTAKERKLLSRRTINNSCLNRLGSH